MVKKNSYNEDNEFLKLISKKRDIIRFVILYVFFFGLITALYIIFKENLSFLNNLTAEVLFILLELFGMDISLNGANLYLPNFSMAIIHECTGIYELIVYSACVLAYFTTPEKKIIGIAFGIPLILGINMIRLIFLAFIGTWFPSIFDYVHYYLWQVTLILIVALMILIWIEKVVKK